jgi:hypothetical protein
MSTSTKDESKRFDFWLRAACILYVANIVGWFGYAIWRVWHDGFK